jgi:hypothetical protein
MGTRRNPHRCLVGAIWRTAGLHIALFFIAAETNQPVPIEATKDSNGGEVVQYFSGQSAHSAHAHFDFFGEAHGAE